MSVSLHDSYVGLCVASEVLVTSLGIQQQSNCGNFFHMKLISAIICRMTLQKTIKYGDFILKFFALTVFCITINCTKRFLFRLNLCVLGNGFFSSEWFSCTGYDSLWSITLTNHKIFGGFFCRWLIRTFWES